MKNILITMGGAKYLDTLKRTVDDAPKLGADQVLVYDDRWLFDAHPTYKIDAKHLLQRPDNRGLGWFAWKAPLLLDAIQRSGPEAAVYYIDGDTFPIASLDPFFAITARDGIMLHRANGWTTGQWTKVECLDAMGMNTPECRAAPAGVARFMGFTSKYIPFLEEWYQWCLDLRCTTFDMNPEIQHPEMKQNRCEQAIMGVMAFREGIKLWREADEFGDTTDPQGLPDSKLDRDVYPRSFTQIWGAGEDHGQGSIFRNVT